MPRPTLASVLLFPALLLTACGADAESTQQEMIDVMNEVADVLRGVQTPSDAHAVRGRLEVLGERMEEAAERMKSFSGQEIAEAMMANKEAWTEAMGAYMTQVMRIGMDRELDAALGNQLEDPGF